MREASKCASSPSTEVVVQVDRQPRTHHAALTSGLVHLEATVGSAEILRNSKGFGSGGKMCRDLTSMVELFVESLQS
jgi:hypothetical protein